VALNALAAYRGPYLKQVLEGVDSFIRALFLSRYRYSTNSYVRTGLFNPLCLVGYGHDSNTLRKPQEWIIILQSIVQAEGAFLRCSTGSRVVMLESLNPSEISFNGKMFLWLIVCCCIRKDVCAYVFVFFLTPLKVIITFSIVLTH